MGPEPIGGLFLRALPMGLRGRANGRELHADPRTDWLVFSGCRAGVRDGSDFLAPRRKTRASLEAVTPPKHFESGGLLPVHQDSQRQPPPWPAPEETGRRAPPPH